MNDQPNNAIHTPLQSVGERRGNILERDPEVVRPHIESNGGLVDGALHRAHDGVLARLFPGDAERAVREAELAQLQVGFDYRRRALEMAVETKLQSVEEMCNHVLVTGKAEIRRKRQEFFAEQKLLLQTSMNDCVDRFHAEMEKRFDNLERLRIPQMRGREEERLADAVDQFHDMLTELANDFVDIIQERVSRG